MQFILLHHVDQSAWPQFPKAEQDRWLAAYRAFDEALAQAGVLKSRNRLKPAATATVRVVDGKPLVLDGPFAESKEQLGGYHLIEVPDRDDAIAWAARCPTALHGAVEVRSIQEMQE